MKTVALGALAFAILRGIPSVALSVALIGQGTRRPDALGDALLALALVAVATSLATAGFVIPTALSATWRGLSTQRAMIIAGAVGLAAPVASLAVVAAIARPLLPLFHSARWLAIALFNGLPGVALGLVAVLIAWIVRRSDAPRPATAASARDR